MSLSLLLAKRVLAHFCGRARVTEWACQENDVESIGRPATRTAASGVRSSPLLGLILAFWRRVRPRSHLRKPTLDGLSDHVLADIGLDGPGHEHATWERYIHR
jgi:hypothetical protein